ncbi:hypothetical protein [Myroides sp. N17-2]|uniref:hypothetical protein n=1 Tax=Myroides sp. N17-2 TaxID=2030799 RepID=UPI000EFB1349|nr:hypothetical protein [Myroides sp. N17-2]
MTKSNLFWTLALAMTTTMTFAGGPSIQLWGGGLTIGSIVAVYLSWTRNQSILWAIIHFFLGWFYVIYNVLTKK